MEYPLYEGRDLWGHLRVSRVSGGLELALKAETGQRRGRWVPFLALQAVEGKLHFALNGPRVREGKVNGDTALEDEPA